MKAVFFDIDGTIWDNKMRIPQSAIDGIRRLRANGHLAFINSGRAKSNILDENLLGIGFDGIVAACGNYVEIGEEVVFQNTLTPEQVKLIIDVADRCNMPIVLEGPFFHYISPDGFEKDPYVDYLFEKLGDRARLTTEYDGKELFVCNKLGIEIDDTYAIGDSNNDVDMLRFVGHGICMGGGMPAAMAVSEFITDRLQDDGLYNALKHYGLI